MCKAAWQSSGRGEVLGRSVLPKTHLHGGALPLQRDDWIVNTNTTCKIKYHEVLKAIVITKLAATSNINFNVATPSNQCACGCHCVNTWRYCKTAVEPGVLKIMPAYCFLHVGARKNDCQQKTMSRHYFLYTPGTPYICYSLVALLSAYTFTLHFGVSDYICCLVMLNQ